MKNNRGFTLVELLAVIAILAILVVIAMHNVMKMFEKARKETFLTEVKTIYTESAKKYISENMQGNHISSISKDNNKLSLDGEEMDYCILLDSQGKVKKLAVSNGKYFIIKNNIDNANSVEITDVNNGTLEGFNCSPSGFKTTVRCEYDGNLNIGATYVNGQYTYTYKPPASHYRLETDGWSVELTDKKSTDPVNTIPCSTINNIPIVSMSSMFSNSNASSIDVSGFDTSNIIDMIVMFWGSKATTITGLDSFDTSNVTSMYRMFDNNQITTLDLSSFNTSKVTSMESMFYGSQATTLDLSSFDTSKVTHMNYMFYNSRATTLDLSSFDTSNVIEMYGMFENASATTGYARTQADANKFNSSSYKPS